jgi:hypothetical protein
MPSLDKQEILLMIERAEEMSVSNINTYVINSILFAVLIIFCQGG